MNKHYRDPESNKRIQDSLKENGWDVIINDSGFEYIFSIMMDVSYDEGYKDGIKSVYAWMGGTPYEEAVE